MHFRSLASCFFCSVPGPIYIMYFLAAAGKRYLKLHMHLSGWPLTTEALPNVIMYPGYVEVHVTAGMGWEREHGRARAYQDRGALTDSPYK